MFVAGFGGALPGEADVIEGLGAPALAVQAGGVRQPGLVGQAWLSCRLVPGGQLLPEVGGFPSQ